MEYDPINGNVTFFSGQSHHGWEDGDFVGLHVDDRNHASSSSTAPAGVKVFSISSPSTSSSSSSPPRCIEHHVTKFDTLAGIAIRYGVEIADIKKMNGLVTDLQMFALKTLQIPLPAKHHPSQCIPNDHTNFGQNERIPTRARSDFLESFYSLKHTPERQVSSAMSSSQGYYGLGSGRHLSEARELVGYNRGSGNGHENEFFMTSSSSMNPPLSVHRKSRSVANGFNSEDSNPSCGNDNNRTNVDKLVQKLSWRRQKSEADFSRAPEKLLKEENGNGGWFSLITGQSLALRTKAASRTNLAASETEANGFATSSGSVTEASSAVRKSSSTSSLQDQDNGSTLSIWSSLKPDIQAALGKPIFDGLPNPITGRKPKTALD